MSTKRRRGAKGEPLAKRLKTCSASIVKTDKGCLAEKVLSSRYLQVWTLRQYLINALPSSSGSRRGRVREYQMKDGSQFLDTTLVGQTASSTPFSTEDTDREQLAFTQSQLRSSRNSVGNPQDDELNDLVDFVIWALFQRKDASSITPKHLLCRGYHQAPPELGFNNTRSEYNGIPGLTSVRVNVFAQALKSRPWNEIYSLLGSRQNEILRSLLLDCGIFVRMDEGKDNLQQICGIPICELPSRKPSADQSSHDRKGKSYDIRVRDGPSLAGSKAKDLEKVGCQREKSCLEKNRSNKHEAVPSYPKTPGSITFVRNRILYARASSNAKGGIRFGMKHVHVLNRYHLLEDQTQTVHIMKYIFPRQFGLHNVFTSPVDKSETTQPFKDYTFREREIKFAEHRAMLSRKASVISKGPKLPKRLRGATCVLVQKIRRNHAKCSYTQMLRHYCPVLAYKSQQASFPEILTASEPKSSLKTQLPTPSKMIGSTGTGIIGSQLRENVSLLAYATPTSNVSAFCRAAMSRILPENSLGDGADGEHNMAMLLSQVDSFVAMRKFESLTLHHVSQGVRLNSISWLRPPGIPSERSMSSTDRRSRLEILHEFLYYVFDSILIPLIRSHFYVTESNKHRNHLFYFRHDVWRRISEPSMASLQVTMFDNLKARDLRKARNSRLLGHSQLRLLPKVSGARPIINLKRKTTRLKGGKTVLNQNINSKLLPAFASLNYEKRTQSERLASALFSVGEAHSRLRTFRNKLGSLNDKELYFAKMDVTSCFDTIPQSEVMRMVTSLLSEPYYEIIKHAELRPAVGGQISGQASKPKYVSVAQSLKPRGGIADAKSSFCADNASRTVFVDLPDPRTWGRKSILKLIQEHVERNVVTMEKRFFKQRKGIPQGSVLSSLLCNFFYGEFENHCLNFLEPEESLLLRLIDDFLLITTNRDHARRFAEIMAKGNPEYGINVNSKKSLVNFEMAVAGVKIPRLHGGDVFPYCGIQINTKSLEVSKLRSNKDPHVPNGLTVDWSKRPGEAFRKKCLTSLRIQMDAMVLDTMLSSHSCVSSNIYQMFMECAMKMYRYSRALSRSKRPNEAIIIATWKDLMNLCLKMTRGKRSTKVISDYECAVSRTQIHWLATAALEHVMEKKQTGYATVLHWARGIMGSCQAGMRMERSKLRELRDQGERVFRSYQY